MKLAAVEDKPRLSGLYGLAFKRLEEINNTKNIINFKDCFSRLSVSFSIPKKDCWEVIFILRDAGLLEIVRGHGIRIRGVEND